MTGFRYKEQGCTRYRIPNPISYENYISTYMNNRAAFPTPSFDKYGQNNP